MERRWTIRNPAKQTTPRVSETLFRNGWVSNNRKALDNEGGSDLFGPRRPRDSRRYLPTSVGLAVDRRS